MITLFLFPTGSLPAYLDPGSGSLIIQIILAASLSIGVIVKIFWRKIQAWFNPKKAQDDSMTDPTEIQDK